MTAFITTAILGLGAGSLVALSASGLVLVFRASGVINFAHCAIGMAGSFTFYELSTEQGLATWPAITLGVLASALFGFLTFIATVVLPRGASILTQCIGTVAVLLILLAAATIRYGQNAAVVGSFLPTGRTKIGDDITVAHDRLLLLGVAIVLCIVTTVVYRYTRFGLATSAVAENPRNLAALGWRVSLLQSANWAIGGALAGLGLILTSPISGIAASQGLTFLVAVLAAALVGSLKSFPLTLAGGLGIGIIQAQLAKDDFGIPGAVSAVPFAVIIVLLLLRGSSLPMRSETGSALPRIGSGRIPVIPVVLLFGGLLAWMLFVADPFTDYDLIIAITVSVGFAIPVLSLTLLLGYAGQLSLAQLTLAGMGALFSARLIADQGWPFIPAVLAGAILTVPVGLIVGIPSMRTRGISLAVATLGLAVALQALVFGNSDISNGTDGIAVAEPLEPLNIFGWEIDGFNNPHHYGVVVIVGFIACVLLVANLRRGRAGRRLIAIRSNERAAAALGIGVSSSKLWAFGLAAGIAGFGGALISLRFDTVLLGNFNIYDNISAVAFSVFGGAGSIAGAGVGSLIAPAGISEYFGGDGSAQYTALIGGIALLLTIIVFRDGAATAAAIGLRKVLAVTGPVGKVLLWGPGGRKATELVAAAREEATSLVEPKPLVVEGVSVAFGGVKALQDVSLSIQPGQVIGVIGPNGAGKTTLIDSITGFAPAQGTVTIGGQTLRPRRPHLRARAGISRSFQSLELFEDLTVFDNLRTASDPRDPISYVIDLVRPKRGQLSSEMLAAIDQFGLRPLLDKLPTELTFGQRRLVSMARSIASAPSVLLLDEPCAGLDEHERAETAAIIRQMAEERGMAVLLIEHDVELVSRVCDELVVLDFGQVIARGVPETVLADRRVVEAYLGAETVSAEEAEAAAPVVTIDKEVQA